MFGIRFVFFCLLPLLLSRGAFAQNVNDFINTFRGTIEQNMRQAAPGQISQQRAGQPSFDCAKATYPDEHAICSNPELSELDKAVAAGFEYLRRSKGDLLARQT